MKIFNSIIAIAAIAVIFSGCERQPVEPYNGEGTTPEFALQPLLVVDNPSEGVTWTPGSSHFIHWKVSSWIKKIDLQLFRKSEYKKTLASNFPVSGQFIWKIPENIRRSVHYRIKIINSEKTDEFDYSKYFFIKD